MSLKVYGLKAFRSELFGVIRDLRVTWLLEELGIPYEHIMLDPEKDENKTPAYLKLNPLGKVPTIDDGGFVLFESAAICEYLADKHGRLIPQASTPDFYTFKQWSYFTLTNVEPHTNRIFVADFFYEKGATTDWVRTSAQTILSRMFTVLDPQLKEKQFLTGEFSVADVFLTTCLRSIEHTPMLNDYPNLQSYYKRCTERPAYIKAATRNGRVVTN